MIWSNDVHTEINRVFMAPASTPADNRRPFLYLLRRDLRDLYGPEDGHPEAVKLKAPLLVSLGIMDGFDLLAKFWTGKHETLNSDTGKFLITYCGLSEHLASALVQFRNGAGHGYRLGSRRLKDNQQFVFNLSDYPSPPPEAIVETAPFMFTIYLWSLKRTFVSAIKAYREQLEASSDLQQRFTVCHANVGECQISASSTNAADNSSASGPSK